MVDEFLVSPLHGMFLYHPHFLKLKNNNKFISVKHKNISLFNLLATSFGH
jgi:hypothetical protein